MKFSSEDRNRKGRYQRDGSQDAKPKTYQCEYITGGGIRCLHAGGISTSITGGGPWYCRTHFMERGTRFADDVAEYSYRTDPRAAKAKQDWREELCEERMRNLKLPHSMTKDEAMAMLSKTVLGRAILKNIGRELKPRVKVD
jgi:hypothetical protein